MDVDETTDPDDADQPEADAACHEAESVDGAGDNGQVVVVFGQLGDGVKP